jgi:hypothetical protein
MLDPPTDRVSVRAGEVFQHLVGPLYFCHRKSGAVNGFLMSEIKKKVGRPAVNSTPITLRLPPDLLSWVDTERAKLDPEPSRPEFIRGLIEAARNGT